MLRQAVQGIELLPGGVPQGIDGFLGTRATFMLDVVTVAMVGVLPLLAWLARHARDRGRPLRAGDVVTAGSCTGLLFACVLAIVLVTASHR